MYDVLIREAAARFGLGDDAPAVLKMLLAYMIDKDRGGLAGFLDKFKTPELGPIVQSWLGGGPSAKGISNDQLESVLGGNDGVLSLITNRLSVGREKVASAMGYLLPALVGKLTPGGSVPVRVSADTLELAQQGQQLLTGPAAKEAPAGGGGLGKWLPWLVALLAILFALGYWGKNHLITPEAASPTTTTNPAATSEPSIEPSPATSSDQADDPAEVKPEAGTPVSDEDEVVPAAMVGSDSKSPESSSETSTGSAPVTDDEAVKPDNAAENDSNESTQMDATDHGANETAASASAAIPTGSGILAVEHDSRPSLQVYFDSADTHVSDTLGDKSKDLLTYLKEHPDTKAVIQGFNDPTGDAEKNAALAKERAQAVQDALVEAGADADQLMLEKPLETTEQDASNAEQRRVDVLLRDGSADD